MAYVATIGFFDGVHLGHQFLIEQLQTLAQQEHLPCRIFSFLQHPRSLIEGQPPMLLLTTQERQTRLLSTGVNDVHLFDFAAIQHLTSRQFMHVLHDQYDVSHLIMGYDHRFGSDHLTDFADYMHLGQSLGIQLHLADPSPMGNISSTKIRHALLQHDLTTANAYLGYAYTLTGIVVPGQHIGTQLGFPTANLQVPADKLIPASGVYAAMVDGRKAIVNIGTNPTFGDHPVSIEVHIPDFDGNLYGQTLSVQLHRFIRPDQRFDSRQALIEQIHQDLKHLDNFSI